MNTKLLTSICSLTVSAVFLWSSSMQTAIAGNPSESHPLWADYGTIGANDDGDLNHPVISASSDGIEHVYDISQPLRFCPTESGYFCLWGHLFNLAVPEHDLKPGETWHFGGYSFAVVPHQTSYPPAPPPPPDSLYAAKRSGSLLGDSFSYYAIAARQDGDKDRCLTVYLFSPERGLIGFIDVVCKNRITRWNMLQQKTGPGSAGFDAAIPTKAFLTKEEVAALAK